MLCRRLILLAAKVISCFKSFESKSFLFLFKYMDIFGKPHIFRFICQNIIPLLVAISYHIFQQEILIVQGHSNFAYNCFNLLYTITLNLKFTLPLCLELRSDYSSTKVYTNRGERAVLVCTLNETVQWKKDGKIITNDGNIKIFQNLLVVNSSDDDDYGEYFCELQNYKGKGIGMRLIMINDDGNGDESTKFLIPFIIVLILLVCLLIVTSYMLLRRRPKLATTIQRDPSARDNEYDNDNGKSSEISMEERLPSGETEEEKYNTLSNVREEEPFYQPLVDVKCEETSPQSMSEASPSNLCEEDDYDNVGAIKDENDHIYAEAK